MGKAKTLAFAVILILVGLGFSLYGGRLRRQMTDPELGRHTVGDRKFSLSPRVTKRLAPWFERAGVSYPPSSVALVFYKDERVLWLYAGSDPLRPIRSYPVLAASGRAGPKLNEGDLQVPEGIYRIEALNPNSRFYLSLRINYPNTADKTRALKERRSSLGGDIMIHGDSVSIGCIAIGDTAIEEIFILASLTDYSQWKIILAPGDLRRKPFPEEVTKRLDWTKGLYQNIQTELERLPPPSSP
jgi:hypothetical protein